jgi:hypothetical protein
MCADLGLVVGLELEDAVGLEPDASTHTQQITWMTCMTLPHHAASRHLAVAVIHDSTQPERVRGAKVVSHLVRHRQPRGSAGTSESHAVIQAEAGQCGQPNGIIPAEMMTETMRGDGGACYHAMQRDNNGAYG